jgi:putative inorganic carbon (HCO3(-)) transporter
MAREIFGSLRSRILKKTFNFLEKTFLVKKLNNWFGYLVILGLALVFGYLLAYDINLGLGLFAIFVALAVFVVCLSSVEAGLFMIVSFSFFAYFISSFFFHYELQVGLIFDCLTWATFLGLIIKNEAFKQNLNAFIKLPLVTFTMFTLFYGIIEILNPNSSPSGTDVLAFRKFMGYIFILFISYSYFDSYQKIRRYITLLFIASTLSALYGCIQQWHGLFNFEMEQILADPHAVGLLFAGGEFRKFSTFSDPSSFGILMAVCAVFFLIISINEKKLLNRGIILAGCLLMILGMGYSGTRTSNAALVGGIAFFILLYFNNKSARILAVVSAFLFVLLLFGPFYGNRTIQRFRTTFTGSKDESYKVRILSRAYIQPYVRSHPIGGGLGTTGFSGAKEHPGHYLGNFQPDSGYVKRAAETGWIGLGIVCILYFLTLKSGIRAFFSVRHDSTKVIYAACICSFFAFYIAEFAQVAIGGIPDCIVYYPLVAIILKLKNFDDEVQSAIAA